MGFHVVLFYHGMVFARCDNIFNLAIPFPDSFDDMCSHVRLTWDGQIRFQAEWGGSPNLKTHGLVVPEHEYGSRSPQPCNP